MNILHVASSPRGDRSVSADLAAYFLQALARAGKTASVDTLDVWESDLPAFDGPALDAKYADLAGHGMDPDQQAVWSRIGELGARFHAADIIVFSVPMWNFGIPYRLKHLIDAVSQRGVLFDFGASGTTGLLGGRKVVICAARGIVLGQDYPPDIFDHQVSYLRTWSRMVGIDDVHVAAAEATLGGGDEAAARMATARADLDRIAANL